MKRLFLILLAVCLLTGCASTPQAEQTMPPTLPTVTVGESHTEFPGVTLELLDVNREGEKNTLSVLWRNETDFDVTYGSSYEIQRLEEDTWVSCAMQEDIVFHLLAYCLMSGQSNTEIYDLTGLYDISQPGTYRFVTDCFVYNDPETSTKCQLFAEFAVADAPVSLDFRAQYIRTNWHPTDASPIQLVDNAQTLADWQAACLAAQPEHKAVQTACSDYTSNFFQDHYLILVLLEEPSGSITHKVRQVSQAYDQSVLISIDRNVPESGTDDMAQWYVIVELSRDALVTDPGDVSLYLDGKLTWDGTPIVTPAVEKVFHAPPKLTLVTPSGETTLKASDYDWTVHQEDGTSVNTITDISSRPPEEKLLAPILINSKYSESIYAITPGGTYEPTNALGYLIKTQWEAQPDTVTYTCWPTDVWTDPETPSKEVYLLEDNAVYVWDECGIYEITATWDAPGYQGTATYYVYFIVVSSCLVAEESSNVCNATRVTFHLEDGSYSFMGGNAVILTDLLLGLNYDPMKVCRCMPEFTVDTDYKIGYGINLRENYVRCDQGQAELTPEQAYAIREYMQWAKSQRGSFSGTVSSR